MKSLPLFASEAIQENVDVSEVLSVYDGDTFRVNIAAWPNVVGHNISVRVKGVDTPEIRGKCLAEKQAAIKARDFTRTMLGGVSPVSLRNIERDKYFRLVADVYIGDVNLADKLLKNGLAVPYDGGKKASLCG